MSKFNVLVDMHAVAYTDPPRALPLSPFMPKFTMYIILKGTRINNLTQQLLNLIKQL